MAQVYDAPTLIALIRHLDAGLGSDSRWDEAGIEYVEVRRWNADRESGNDQDEKATKLLRALLREKLGGFPLDEIGAAVLAEIDAGESS
jgi:hypothetical protein